VVNARHIAYGLSMINRFKDAGPFKCYLIFSLTEETFALLSSLDEKSADGVGGVGGDRHLFMFYVSALNQFYWTAGSVIGAAAGALIPFSMEGIGFALTALFIVLMIEQILRVKKPGVFVVSVAAAILTTLFLPGRVSLLSAMALSLALASVFTKPRLPKQPGQFKGRES
jgi:4-azaleucine resistance transporter AzlC